MNETPNTDNHTGQPTTTEWDTLAEEPTESPVELEPILEDPSLTQSEKSVSSDQERQQQFEQYAGQELTGEDYATIANKSIDQLYNAFDPDNSDAESMTKFADKIYIYIIISSMAPEITSATPDDVFANIKKSYLEAAESARNSNHEIEASSHERQAGIVDDIKHDFVWQVIERDATAKNQTTEATTVTPDTINPLSGDAIG